MDVKEKFIVSWRVLLDRIRRKGGVEQSYRTALAIFRRHGWKGVKRKIFALGNEISSATIVGLERNDYPEWIRRYDTLTEQKRIFMSRNSQSFPVKALISVVMPTYNPNLDWLLEAIESVKSQIYPHWELCIADDCSTDARIRPILERMMLKLGCSKGMKKK